MLDGILDKIDFNYKDKLSDAAMSDLVNHFNIHKLGNEFITGDMLGDSYEYLIAQFAWNTTFILQLCKKTKFNTTLIL